MGTKEQARREALERRDSLGETYRIEQAKKIAEQLFAMEVYQKAEIILSYHSIRSEVATQALNETILAQGKQLYLPKTYPAEQHMFFYPVSDLTQLEEGYQGIMEPEEAVSLEPSLERVTGRGEILMLMPGVAFDEKGHRIGYGGGYYDRYLLKYGKKLASVFLAFEEQCMQEFEPDEHDIKPNYILTQKKMRHVDLEQQ